MGKASRKKRDLRIERSVNVKDLHYDLRSPCDDCPFRTDAPWHEGIFAELQSKTESFYAGTLVHTCHKTDRRADCDVGKRAPAATPLQHCAGAIIMAMKYRQPQVHLVSAQLRDVFHPDRMNLAAPVFASAAPMLAYYLELCRDNHKDIPASQRAQIDKIVEDFKAVLPAPTN